MKNQSKIRLGLALGVALVSPAAHADQRPGSYVGLRGGTATVDVEESALGAVQQGVFGSPMFSAQSSLDDSDTTWSLFGGYRFNRFLALEAGYTDLGSAHYFTEGLVPPGASSSSLREATLSIDSETKGFSAGLVANLPLGTSFDLHANLGLLFSDTEITLRATSFTGSLVESQSNRSESDQDVFYRAGLGWQLNENWSLSLDYQLYKDVGEEGMGETDIDAVTLSAAFQF